MTKRVRVENADTSDKKIAVQVWDRAIDGRETMSREIILNNPCDMTGGDIYVTATRFLVIKEV